MKKYLNFIFLATIIVSLSIIVSCKEDEPAPFEIPESVLYFNGKINSQEKTIVIQENELDGNGYECWVGDSCATTTNGLAWFAYSRLAQTAPKYYINNREEFTIKFHNLENTVITNRDSMINLYFQQPMPFAYIDTTIGIDERYFGAEVIWVNSNGELYSSMYLPQTNNLIFDFYRMDSGELGITINIESSVSCNLYCRSTKDDISLTDGKTRLRFQSGCL